MHEKAVVEAEGLGAAKRAMGLQDLARAHLGKGNRKKAVEIQRKLRAISKTSED